MAPIREPLRGGAISNLKTTQNRGENKALMSILKIGIIIQEIF